MQVQICGRAYNCTTAIKGPDYVRLINYAGTTVASFDNVSDFSVFTLISGAWTDAKGVDDCPVAVIREDGSVAKCGAPIKQFLRSDTPFNGSLVLTKDVQYGNALPTTGMEGQVFFKI